MVSRPRSGQIRWRRGYATAVALLGYALITLGTSAAPGAALPSRVPPMAAMERGEYRARDARTGEGLWRHEWTLERRTENGWTVVRVAQEGQGRREGPAPTAWTAEIQMRLSEEHFWLASRREVRDHLGALVEIEERVLDSAAGLGRFSVAHPRDGRTESRRFVVARRTIDVEMLPVELRLLPETEGQRMAFDLVTANGDTISMEARIVGREVVQVPAGTFECYRIALAPRGAMGLLAGLLLPKTFMWHTVAAPHFWVKYRGTDRSLGFREILRELIRFDRSGE
jgi:hypothetical protein